MPYEKCKICQSKFFVVNHVRQDGETHFFLEKSTQIGWVVLGHTKKLLMKVLERKHVLFAVKGIKGF